MKKKKNWWEEHNLSQRDAERLLIPHLHQEWKTYARGERISLWARRTLWLGAIFILAEIIWGNSEPFWGVIVATIIVVLLMIASAIFLRLHKKDKEEILNHSSYRQLFLDVIKNR